MFFPLLDESGQEQGPFTSMQMASWAAAGHLPMDLKVRRGGSATNEQLYGSGVLYYTSISSLYPKMSNDNEAELFVAKPEEDIANAIQALKKVIDMIE